MSFGGGSFNYFDAATGSNSHERQSWRDSFNGGEAAGDITGNVNARLDAERAAFQGATWSGSSTQPSAIELAQAMAGPGHSVVATGPQAAATSGPGRPSVEAGGQTGYKGAGPGSRIGVGGGGPLTTKIKDSATGGWAGLQVLPNPWFSDVENWWEPRYGEPGEWLGGIVNIAADGLFSAARASDAGFGTRIVSGHKPGTAFSDMVDRHLEQPRGQMALDAFDRQFSTWDRQLHEMLNGSKPYVGGGF